MGVTGLKSSCQQDCNRSGGSRGEVISLAFFSLLEAAYTPWLMEPSSHEERDHLSPQLCFHSQYSFSDSASPLAS